MQNHREMNQTPKSEWTKPELVDLDLGMDDVQNGAGVGSDGAGGLNTSAS